MRVKEQGRQRWNGISGKEMEARKEREMRNETQRRVIRKRKEKRKGDSQREGSKIPRLRKGEAREN